MRISPWSPSSRGEDNGDLFRHYGEDESFDPRQMRADRLCDLIEAVVRRSADRGTVMDDKERYERGLSKRRKALGNAYVDRTIAGKDAVHVGIPGDHHPQCLG